MATKKSRRGGDLRPFEVAARRRALKVVNQMRRKGRSMTAASRAAHTDPRTVKKYAHEALRQLQGHYRAVRVDQMARPMRVLTPQGLNVVDVRSSRTATRIAEHWAAIDHYLRTGDPRRLEPFAGKRFRVKGALIPFVTDLRALERLANAGQVQFEDLYESTA